MSNNNTQYIVICPYCDKEADLTDSEVIYGTSYGMIYLCTPCDAYVGTHKHCTDHKPLGTPANKPCRKARSAAHEAFDPLWRTARDKVDARHAAYRLMQELLNLPPAEAHIGMLNVSQCYLLIHLLTDIKPFD